MDHLYTINDQFGFPTQVMVTMMPPEGAVPGPAVNEMFEVDTVGYWYDGQEWISIGPKPNDWHVMDKLNKTWIPNYDGVRQHLSRELDRERVRRNQYDIEVNGVMFDGDNTAQTNVKSKIEEVRSRIDLGIGMPAELLVWRDANNQTHSWNTINEYYAWLQTFAVQLADRGTRLYIAMWQHKAVIDAKIDAQDPINEIAEYDVTTGWDADS